MLVAETLPWALGTQKLEQGKAGECFRNHHSILTLRDSYTATLSQAAFLNYAEVCST